MKHYGDICTLSGYDLEPVDLIVGGSPCQDLSVAGLRKGIKHSELGDEETTRSGLFMEMIRIIREMREKTNGEYPKFVLWENVPGATSANNGLDFSAVLGEFSRLIEPNAPDVPVPEEGWTKSGILLVSNGAISWRITDAQFFGVPQRRRRIALIVSFGNESAWKVLAESQGMPWHFAESRKKGQSVAGETAKSTGNPGESLIALSGDNRIRERERERESNYDESQTAQYGVWRGQGCHTGCGRLQRSSDLAISFQERAGKPWGGKGILIQHYRIGALSTMNIQAVCYGIDQQGGKGGANITEDVSPTLASDSHGTPHAVCYGISSNDSNTMKSSNPDSGIYEADTSRSLDTKGADPSCNQGGIMIVEDNDHALSIQGNMIGRQDQNGPQGLGVNEDISFTLNGTDRPAVFDPSVHHGYRELTDVSETVRSRYGTGGNNVPFIDNEGLDGDQHVMAYQGFADYKESGVTSSLKQRDYKDATDLVCGEINPDSSHDTEQTECYGESSFAQYSEGVAPVRAAGGTVGWGGENLVRRNLVRRLTPLECERLQGFPDGWTKIQNASDSQRYKALGNSIALPFWEMLAVRLVEMGDVKTIGSLFSGIGGFELAFYRAGAKTLWNSEIEKFCQDVVAARFDENGDLKDGWQ